MQLTKEQKIEISDYIVSVAKYRETYDELYDHILNSLTDNENPFSLSEVDKIVNNEFGGFSEVVYQEKIYQAALGKKYHKHFRMQFIESIKWPGPLLFVFSLAIYYSSKTTPFNTKYMFAGISLSFSAIAVFVFGVMIFNRIKYSKYSIWDSHLGLECCFGMGMMNSIMYWCVNGNFFGLNDNNRLIVMLILFSFCSIYIRTFINFYKKKSQILPAR
jgi:hypothetical protein